MLGLMCNLEPLENQVESWKSPGNLFLLKGTNPVSSIGAGPMIWDNFFVELSAATRVHTARIF